MGGVFLVLAVGSARFFRLARHQLFGSIYTFSVSGRRKKSGSLLNKRSALAKAPLLARSSAGRLEIRLLPGESRLLRFFWFQIASGDQ